MPYTHNQAIRVFRKVDTLISNNPDLLKEEGVIRLSGDQNAINQFINNVLKNNANLEAKNTFSIHEYIGALKYVFKDYSKEENQAFKTGVQSILTTTQLTIDPLMNELLYSCDSQSLDLAEMIYIFMNIATVTQSHKQLNKMTANNIGISLAPMFMLSSDVSFDNVQKYTKAIENTINNGRFKYDMANAISFNLSNVNSKIESEIKHIDSFISATKESIKSNRADIKKHRISLAVEKNLLQEMKSALDNKDLSGHSKTDIKAKVSSIQDTIDKKESIIEDIEKMIHTSKFSIIKDAKLQKKSLETKLDTLANWHVKISKRYENKESARVCALIQKSTGKKPKTARLKIKGQITEMTASQFKKEFNSAQDDYSRDYDLTASDEAFFSQLNDNNERTFFATPRTKEKAVTMTEPTQKDNCQEQTKRLNP